jgi:hypothetical protein
VEFYSSYPVTAIMSLFFIAIYNKATRFVDTQRRWKINEGINHRWLLLVKRICAYLVMKSTSPLLPADVGLSVEELALAARGRELTYFLFVCFSLRLCDVSADLVRRQQELQGDAHLTLKNLCLEVIISSVRVWCIPPQKIFWKKPTMESRA